MTRIDRPALRVSSHQRRAAALAAFVRRHSDARLVGEHGEGALDSAALGRLLREEEERN